jgi:sarcosine oxidase subunit beta
VTRAVDVVVVGAGVVGASVAYHLVARGAKVVVVDRGFAPGGGSTARATGGYRAQFGTEVNVRLSLLSRDKLRRFRDELGADPGYRPVGYLFLASDAAGLAALETARAVQRAAGFDEARPVTPEEALALSPGIRIDGVVGGVFAASDGFIVPTAILGGYLDAARRLGAEVIVDAPVTALPKDGERIIAVDTPRGRIACGHVVNAAGAWAADVARLAGVALPVTPEVRHVLPTVGPGRLRADDPMTIFVDDGFHFRLRDGRALLLRPGPVERIEPAARARVPALDGVAVDRAGAWSGFYEMSPDHHAIIGAVGNLVLANGSSGHGVMHSPALGQLVAEIILDGRAHSVDVRALRPQRFDEGEPVVGVGLL